MEANIHASCVGIGGKGVLLLGESGAGKSDVALQLIDGGARNDARLVADDRTILFARQGVLYARAPASIAGLIEIRSVGIIALPAVQEIPVLLVVRLGEEEPRLPAPQFYQPPDGLDITAPPPQIVLDGRYASTPARIRAALQAFSGGLFRDTFILKEAGVLKDTDTDPR